MTTTTIPLPTQSAAQQANGQAFRAELDRREASQGMRNWLAGKTRSFKAWFTGAWDTIQGSAVGEAAKGAGMKAFELLKKVVKVGTNLNWFYLLGAALTCQAGRDFLRKAASKAAQIVTAPLRFVGRILRWGLRRFGWGRTVIAKVEAGYDKVMTRLATEFSRTMDWLDEREHSGAMRWARPFFQGGIVNRAIKHYAPARFRTALYIANLFAPTVGVGGVKHGVESKSHLLNDASKATRSAEEKVEAVTEPVTVIKSETVKGYDTVEESFINLTMKTYSDGRRMVVFRGREYAADDLPGTLMAGKQAEDLARLKEAQTTRAAAEAAASNGDVPENRAARREGKKSTAKQHGPRPRG